MAFSAIFSGFCTFSCNISSLCSRTAQTPGQHAPTADTAAESHPSGCPTRLCAARALPRFASAAWLAINGASGAAWQGSAFADALAAFHRVEQRRAGKHPVEDRLAVVVAASDDGRSIGPPVDAPLALLRDATQCSRVARPARCQLVRYGASCVPHLPAVHCFGSAGDADAPR